MPRLFSEHLKTKTREIARKVGRGYFWLSTRFSDQSLLILKSSKKLPKEIRSKIDDAVLERQVGLSMLRLPRNARHVVNSFFVGQVPWYFVGPAIPALFPGIRESPLRWTIWGLDKLFVASDKHIYETPGIAWENATIMAQVLPKNKLVGGLLLAGELATDFSRAFIEYWAQRKTGLMADVVARTYGQAGRPFPLRYSSFEAYQKIISYLARPHTIGSYEQIRSSIGGIMGSLFRTGPQLAAILALHNFLDKHQLHKYTPGGLVESGLKKMFPKMQETGRKKVLEARRELAEHFGRSNWRKLRLQLIAQQRSLWPFFIFRWALTEKEAELFDESKQHLLKAYLVYRGARLQKELEPPLTEFSKHLKKSAEKLEELLGKKARKIPQLSGLRKCNEGETNLKSMQQRLGMLIEAHDFAGKRFLGKSYRNPLTLNPVKKFKAQENA